MINAFLYKCTIQARRKVCCVGFWPAIQNPNSRSMVRVRILRGSKSFATGLWVWSGSNFNRTNRTGFYAYAIWFHPDINNLSAILLVLKLDCWMFVFCLFCLFVSLSRIDNKTSLCANFQLSSSSKTENLHTGIFLTATTVYWFSKCKFWGLDVIRLVFDGNNSHSTST